MRLQPTIYNPQPRHGQGLMEAILAIAVFAAIAGVLLSMAVGGFRGLEQGGEQTEAEALAQLGIEAVKSIRDRAWNTNTYEAGGVQVQASDGQWIFANPGTSEGALGTNGKFTRSIIFSPVCRDTGTHAIATCSTCSPGCYTDPHTKEAAVSVQWNTRGNVQNTVERRAYVTNWDSRDQLQDTTAQSFNCTAGACLSVEYSTTLGDQSSITLTPQ